MFPYLLPLGIIFFFPVTRSMDQKVCLFGSTEKQPIRGPVEGYIFVQLLLKWGPMCGPKQGHITSSSLTILCFNFLFWGVAHPLFCELLDVRGYILLISALSALYASWTLHKYCVINESVNEWITYTTLTCNFSWSASCSEILLC